VGQDPWRGGDRTVGHTIPSAGARGAIGALALFVAAAASLDARGDDRIRIPGGRVAMSEMLGWIDPDPERFASSLNRRLATRIHSSGEWQSVEARAELIRYLALIRELEAAFPDGIALAVDSKPGRKAAQSWAKMLGYRLRISRKGAEADRFEEEEWKVPQRAAASLGWDVQEIADRLAAGERVTLEIHDDDARSPLDFDTWNRMTGGGATPEDGLVQLAVDQRLSLMVIGSQTVTRETKDWLVESGLLPWIYDNASTRFFRYGASIQFRNGELVVPGGSDAVPVWNSIVGVSPLDAEGFVRAVMGHKRAHRAYLWHAMFFAPPSAASYYLRPADAESKDRKRFFKQLLTVLPENEPFVHYDRARGSQPGLAFLARSMPVSDDGVSLELPGGARLWYQSVKGDKVPDEPEALEKLARRMQRGELDEDDLIIRLLRKRIDIGAAPTPASPRLMRTMNTFSSRPELLTAENVVLLSRAIERYPQALIPLEDLELRRDESIMRYLLTVRHLDKLVENNDNYLLIANFQAGVDLLRMLSGTNRLAQEVLEDRFVEYMEIHHGESSALRAVSRQLDWLTSVLESLPAVEPSDPGRGPVEAALLSALTGCTDPQDFSWRGMEYSGRRARDIAGVMLSNLEYHEIPSSDRMLRIHGKLNALADVCRAADLESAKTTASAVLEALGGLPDIEFEPRLPDGDLKGRLLPVDRPKLEKAMNRVLEKKKAKKLPALEPRVHEWEKWLAGDLRPYLLASSYLVAMGEQSNLLFDEKYLIQKHTLIRKFENVTDRILVADTPWMTTQVMTAQESEFGARIAGHVSGVGPAIATYHVAMTEEGEALAFRNPKRHALWYHDLIRTPWSSITPEISHAVYTLVQAGDEILEASFDKLDGPASPALEFVIRRVPQHRVERAALSDRPQGHVSPSERLMLGLAAFERPAQAGDLLSEESADALRTVIEALGEDWKRELDRAGTRTTSINGRGRPWVGDWPSYEALENESDEVMLYERELVDLRLAVLAYIGKHRLPGEVAGDLLGAILERLDTIRMEVNGRDWPAHLRWAGSLDDAYWDERMRECLQHGRYSLKQL
jgi:hypothetical protein